MAGKIQTRGYPRHRVVYTSGSPDSRDTSRQTKLVEEPELPRQEKPTYRWCTFRCE